MSRETLGGSGVLPPVAGEGADLDLDGSDEVAGGITEGTGGPAARPHVTARRYAQVLRTALVALVVAVLAGSLATVAEQRRAQAGAADDVRLLGAFALGGSSMGQTSPEGDTAQVSGLLNVVNAGPDPVELTGATVSGVPAESLRPRRVEPGEAVQLHTSLDLPCARPVDDRVSVDLRVFADGGRPGPEQQESLEDLPGEFYPLREVVLGVCSGGHELARVTRMEVDADGTILAGLRSLSRDDVQLRVLLAPRMGAVVNGGAAVEAVVPAFGETRLRLTITIEDCERARQSIGADYEVLIVEAGVGRPGAMGYLQGWQPSVGVAAFGFALARQC